jgi:hypothetical protein
MLDGLPRRSLLAGGALAGLLGASAGCTSGPDEPAGGAAADVSDEGARRRAARDSAALLARYDATATAHPSLAGVLEPLRAVVAAHLTALGSSPAADPPGGAPEVPAEPAGAVTALADAERETATARQRALDGVPPETARLLASLAAAGSAQAHLLNEVRP